MNTLERFVYFLFGLLVGSMLAHNAHAEVSVLAGVARFNKTDDGIYRSDSPGASGDYRLTPPVMGLRYDGDGWAVQYTAFGRVESNATAVTADAPAQGGYIANTGRCVGTCAPLARWKMHSDVQSISLFKVWRSGNWSFEAGANLAEVRTNGHVEYALPDTQPDYHYKEGRTLDLSPVWGIGYHMKDSAIRLQVFKMEGRATDGGNDTPANFREDYQLALTGAWSFK